MGTNTAATAARQYHQRMVHYLAKTVDYTMNGGTVGVLPAGAMILRGNTYIHTGFNDTTADDINVGIAGETDRYVSAVDCNSAAITAFDDLAIGTNYRVTSDQTILWEFATAATGDGSAGVATIVIEYVMEE